MGDLVTCRELADFIIGYLDGDLAADVREKFDRHLTRCPNCRRYLAAYETTVSLGRHAFDDRDATADATGAPDDLIKAILSSRSRST
jgi:anti-sigma factor RsiW